MEAKVSMTDQTWSVSVNRTDSVKWWSVIMCNHVVWIRWKQPCGPYRVVHLLSLPTAQILKSQVMSSQTLSKGRKLAPSSLKWNLQVLDIHIWKEYLTQLWLYFICAFIATSRSNCGATDWDGPTCRQDSGLPTSRAGELLLPSVLSDSLKWHAILYIYIFKHVFFKSKWTSCHI